MARKTAETRLRRGLLASLLVASAACLLAPGAALAGTLDQQQTDASSSGESISSNQSQTQTFTAGLSGKIDQVDLHLFTEGTALPLSIEIRSVSGGVPSTTVLAATSVPASSVSDTAAFVPISFASPATVVAGTQYAIVAYTGGSPGNDYSWTESTTANPYAGGAWFVAFSSPPTTTWTAGGPPADDFAFKTYVVPPSPPSPPSPPAPAGPTGQRAAALKKCKKKRSHKARKKCNRKAKLLPV